MTSCIELQHNDQKQWKEKLHLRKITEHLDNIDQLCQYGADLATPVTISSTVLFNYETL